MRRRIERALYRVPTEDCQYVAPIIQMYGRRPRSNHRMRRLNPELSGAVGVAVLGFVLVVLVFVC